MCSYTVTLMESLIRRSESPELMQTISDSLLDIEAMICEFVVSAITLLSLKRM